MNWKIRLVLILFLGFFCSNIFAQKKQPKSTDTQFELSKYLDVYNSLFRELSLFYVDTIRPKKLIEKSIEDMLAELDPYTTYIPEDKTEDFKFMTTGEYGGIGAVVSMNKKNEPIISEPYEGMPAQKVGLRAGDILREVDGKILTKKTISEVSEMLRGKPQTEVKITVEREGAGKIKKTIVREKIQINPVPYYGIVNDGIGYVRLTQFTDKSAEEVEKALLDLKNNNMQSLVLDLRSNPGGLLDQAIRIVNFFVERNLKILDTKGKMTMWDMTYKTEKDPILPNIPLVVLIDENSASASEIVSGAIQDLDRGVVVGMRSYGKGLVQSTRQVAYGGYLKLTSAKYYTPSGRCIQAIDYSHRDEKGRLSKVPDSLMNSFKTRGGRVVKDGGGIMPDVEVNYEQSMNLTSALLLDNVIFDYATKYVQTHKTIAEPDQFSITDADFEAFKNYVKGSGFEYKPKSLEVVKMLKDMLKNEELEETTKLEYEALIKALNVDIGKEMNRLKDEITRYLNMEIVTRYYYQKGQIRCTLRTDKQLKKAIEILQDANQYNQILKR